MNPCNCAGINVTWACNVSCKHCFYRRNPNLHKNIHRPLQEIIQEIRAARTRGIDRIVLIGEGEPTLHLKIDEIIMATTACGVKSNIITNGTMPIAKYAEFFKLGLNHLQISAHAIRDKLDTIMERQGVGAKQAELISWLKSAARPFRTNTSLQQLNYQDLPDIAEYLIEQGSFHVSLLGFLPHYEWKDHIQEIAVHPARLRPFIEQAADKLIASGTFFTIRYHPLCHLSPEYWKYVVNARYVLYDPWEWDYGQYNPSWEKVWPAALALGEGTAIHGEPCSKCRLRLHCGGWNRYYAQAFDGAGLEPITDDYAHITDIPGALHDMNPANNLKGYCVDGRPI